MGDEALHSQHNVLNTISRLPRKMLSLKNQENITEFVLHDLCNKKCFNLEKAAYFVDNPDLTHSRAWLVSGEQKHMHVMKIFGKIHDLLVRICKGHLLIKRYVVLCDQVCVKAKSQMKKSFR